MKTKTINLDGIALDWAVAKAEGYQIGLVFGRGTCKFLGVHRSRNGGYSESMPFALASTRKQTREADYPGVFLSGTRYWQPSTDWAQGGPIIERIHGLLLKQWLECKPELRCQVQINNHEGDWVAFGPTPLIAAMRCYVASKLGDEVDVPEELL